MAIKLKLNGKYNSVSNIRIKHNCVSGSSQNSELFQPSTRDYFSLFWFKSGEGSYYIDFNKYTFKPGRIVIISKDQLHYFEDQNSPFEFVEISFTEDFISRSSAEIVKMLSFCIREHFEGKQILEIDRDKSDYLQSLITYMTHIEKDWEGGAQLESLFHLLQLFLVYCNKLQDENLNENEQISLDNTEIVGKFTTLLEGNFKKTQKVNYYCDQLFITYNTLVKYTKSYCGRTPKEIIAERVVLEAKRMLSISNIPVKEVAYELGFDEPTNLVKYFKKQTGFTPSGFRKLVRV